MRVLRIPSFNFLAVCMDYFGDDRGHTRSNPSGSADYFNARGSGGASSSLLPYASGAVLCTSAERCVAGLSQQGSSAVLSATRPSAERHALRHRVVETLEDVFARLPARLVVGGSFAKGTDLPNDASDVDVVLLWEEFDDARYEELFSIVEDLLSGLDSGDYVVTNLGRVQDDGDDGYLSSGSRNEVNIEPWRLSGRGRASTTRHTWHISGAMEFVRPYCGDTDKCNCDILIGGDFPDGDVVEMLLSATPSQRSLWGPSLVERHVALLADQSSVVKDAILLAKWWKHQVVLPSVSSVRLSSFLLVLLTLNVARHSEHAVESEGAYNLFCQVLRAITQWKTLRVVWSWAELLDSGRLELRDECPLVLDIVNPTNNVARTVKSWAHVSSIAGMTLDLLSSQASRAPSNILVHDDWNGEESRQDSDSDICLERSPWEGFEDIITEDNCHMFGLNDYVFDKYGGMMGFSSWFGD
eukprot:TRINITY_DN29024_c0_g1_i1.p1 TRINITY_DN29024_c0_g1~~TRINITY_DN29024_c0_g1_i1.p1  ORF type:complete len:470 (-),score=59.00 TRINITY_DN29024_c0_g1_i1:435-1844(-)